MHDDIAEIDDVDFSLLKVIRDAGRPLWKTHVRKLLNDRQDELPILDVVSTQTVGRRIDNLANEGLLDTEIIQPDDLNRDLVIAFTLTESGEEAVKEKRRAYLRNIVRRDIFRDFADEDIPRQPLLQAIKDEFDLQDTAVDRLAERFNSVELASILALYYVEVETQDTLTEQTRKLTRSVARSEKTFDKAIGELD